MIGGNGSDWWTVGVDFHKDASKVAINHSNVLHSLVEKD